MYIALCLALYIHIYCINTHDVDIARRLASTRICVRVPLIDIQISNFVRALPRGTTSSAVTRYTKIGRWTLYNPKHQRGKNKQRKATKQSEREVTQCWSKTRVYAAWGYVYHFGRFIVVRQKKNTSTHTKSYRLSILGYYHACVHVQHGILTSQKKRKKNSTIYLCTGYSFSIIINNYPCSQTVHHLPTINVFYHVPGFRVDQLTLLGACTIKAASLSPQKVTLRCLSTWSPKHQSVPLPKISTTVLTARLCKKDNNQKT